MTNKATLSVWIYETSINLNASQNAYNGRILEKGYAGVDNGYLLDAVSSNQPTASHYCSCEQSQSKIRFIGGQGIMGNRCYTFNRWHHILVTFNNGLKKIYIDGVLDVSLQTSLVNIPTNNLPLRIGYTQGSSGCNCEYFKGKMDDIRIYNRDLSESEITALYESEKPSIIPTKGVTIITHGFSLFGSFPEWCKNMAKSIRNKVRGGSIFINNPNTGQWIPIDTTNTNNPNDEIILLYDWAAFSRTGLSSSSYAGNGYLEAAADNLFAMLNTSPILGADSLITKPIHFIGHSRGGILTLQVLHRLSKYFPNKKIEQVTLLDPHPGTIFGDVKSDISSSPNLLPCVYGNATSCGSTGCDGGDLIYLKIPDNVLTTDNYFRKDGSYEGVGGFVAFDGVTIAGGGRFNRQLKNGSNNFIDADCPWNADVGGAHSKIHAWYFGTIVNSGSVGYEGCTISNITPDVNWYTANIYQNWNLAESRVETGYNYSRLGDNGYPCQTPNVSNRITLAEMESALRLRTGFGLRPVFNGDFEYGDGVSGWLLNGGESDNIGFTKLGGNTFYQSNGSVLTHSYFYFPKDTLNNEFGYLKFNCTTRNASNGAYIKVSFLNYNGIVVSAFQAPLSSSPSSGVFYCPITIQNIPKRVGTFRVEIIGTAGLNFDNFDFTNTVVTGGTILSSITGTKDLDLSLNSLKVYPNPFQEVVNLEYELPKSSKVTIQLANLMGQTVYTTNPNLQTAGKQHLQLPVNLVPNGIYILTVKTDFGAFSSKMLKNN